MTTSISMNEDDLRQVITDHFLREIPAKEIDHIVFSYDRPPHYHPTDHGTGVSATVTFK